MSATINIPLSDEQENAQAWKNVRLYLLCQAFGGASAPVNIALGGLVGSHLLGEDKSLATAPVTAYNIGVAIGALAANMLMRRVGRKLGFMAGCGIGYLGMVYAGVAVIMESFWGFCLALVFNGIAGGFVQQYRFAAADRGTADFKPKAISLIMAGGIAAAIIGPQLVIHTSDMLRGYPFAGAFIMASLLFVVSFVFLFFLVPSNLAAQGNHADEQKEPRKLFVIARQPRFFIAVLCGVSTYALMAFVMTGAPLAMTHHGHTMEHAALGIQWHVMAMFAPSLFTGHLIARFGKEAIVATGLVILVACAFVALSGVELMHFWGALVLLGLGWNFGFIGATAMVTDTYEPHEKNRAQGLNDFLVFGSVAFASLMAGQTLNAFGWDMINMVIFPVVAICLAGLLWLRVVDSVEVARG